MLRIKGKVPPWLRYAEPYRRLPDPAAKLGRELRAIEQRHIDAFVDAVAQLVLKDAEHEAERKRKYTVRIRSCA